MKRIHGSESTKSAFLLSMFPPEKHAIQVEEHCLVRFSQGSRQWVEVFTQNEYKTLVEQLNLLTLLADHPSSGILAAPTVPARDET